MLILLGFTIVFAGSDITKDDGIYSAFFIDINSSGRYNVKVIHTCILVFLNK